MDLLGIPVKELLQLGGGGAFGVVLIIVVYVLWKRIAVLETTMEAVRAEVVAINSQVTHLHDTRVSSEELYKEFNPIKEAVIRIDERLQVHIKHNDG